MEKDQVELFFYSVIVISFLIMIFYSIKGGINVKKKYNLKFQSKLKFKENFCSIRNVSRKQNSVCLSTVIIEGYFLVISTWFPLLFLSDDIGLIQKIELKEIVFLEKKKA